MTKPMFKSIQGPPASLLHAGVRSINFVGSRTVYLKRGDSAAIVGSMSNEHADYILRACEAYAASTGEYPK